MTKLTTVQTALLTWAAQRSDGSLLPLADGTGPISAGIRSSIAALIKRSLAQEVAVGDAGQSWRRDGEQLFGVSITAEGRAAVGIEQAPASANDAAPVSPEPTAGLPAPVASQTKSALVLSLLRRDDGATAARAGGGDRLAAAHHASRADRSAQEGACDREGQAR